MASSNDGTTAREIAKLLQICAALSYAVSLFLPAFECGRHQGFPGYGVLLTGWMAFLWADFRWIANILLPITALMVRNYLRRPTIHGPHPLLALPALGLIALMIWSIVLPAQGCEGGDSAPGRSTGLAFGGYLWVASGFLICAAYVPMYFVRPVTIPEADAR